MVLDNTGGEEEEGSLNPHAPDPDGMTEEPAPACSKDGRVPHRAYAQLG
jgi:hypothetical protein